MANLFAMAVPIQPGQTERWLRFSKDLKGKWFNDFKANRRKLGVHERTFLQKTPMGDLVIVTLEGNDPSGAFEKFAQGKDPFTKWFMDEVKIIHNLDLSAPPQGPMPDLFIDSNAAVAAGM